MPSVRRNRISDSCFCVPLSNGLRLSRAKKQKKPTWSNAQRHSTTSAYFLTSFPTLPIVDAAEPLFI